MSSPSPPRPDESGRTDTDKTITTSLRHALEESDFYAARGLRPPARLVQGSPDHIWDVVAKLLLLEAKSEYLGMEDPSQVVAAGVQERLVMLAARTLREIRGRGVNARQVLARVGTQAAMDSFPEVRLSDCGEARLVDRLPAKACVVDRRFALLPIDLKVLAHGMVIITDPAVVSILTTAHQMLWRLGEDPRAHGDEPPTELRPILAMLASGLPDSRAAQRAGMSARTYSRRVSELLRLLGARSRFEAGAEAARRGWL